MSMQTDALIQSLSTDLPKVAPGAVARRIVLGLGLGALASAALMLAWLGPRPDLALALSTPMFWIKLAYTTATGLILAVALTRLARPAMKLGALAAAVAAPFAVVAVMAMVRLGQAPAEMRHDLMMGHTSMLCPWRIAVIGLPLLAGAIWAVRGLAPTRLALAGLAAGGCAGGFGAAIYALACGETSSPRFWPSGTPSAWRSPPRSAHWPARGWLRWR